MNAKNIYWLVKREFWEHRGGFFWAPVITSAVFLVLNLMAIVAGEVTGKFGMHMGTIDLDGHTLEALKLHALDADGMRKVGDALDVVMLSTSGLLGVVFGFVVFFYCLGTLYDDRRDRSFLFWKSLPISDTCTVVSKVIAATLAAPIIAMLCGLLTGLIMLLMFAFTLSMHGVSVWWLLTLSHPFQLIGFLIGSIPLYLLWALPAVGWLMLCSSWARSKPFLWAVVIPVAVGVIISWFNLLQSAGFKSGWYWREILVRILFSVFPGGWLHNTAALQLGDNPDHVGNFFTLANSYAVLTTPGIWIGAAAGIVMLAGAVWFRRWRDDS
jgi:ABC-2 type transport system permease protein